MGNPPSQLSCERSLQDADADGSVCVYPVRDVCSPAALWGGYRQACAKVLEIQTSTDALLAHVLAALDACDDGA